MLLVHSAMSRRFNIVLKIKCITTGLINPERSIETRKLKCISCSYLSNTKLIARPLSVCASYSPLHHNFSFYPQQKSNFGELHEYRSLLKRNLYQDAQQAKKINSLISDNANDWNKLLMIFDQYGDQFDIIHWSTFVNRLGKFRKHDILTFKKDKRYARSIERITSIFSSNSLRDVSSIREVSNVIHALAKLDEPVQIIFDKVEQEADYVTMNGEPRQLSNIAWSCGTLDIQAPEFFKLLEQNMSTTMYQWNSQDISNAAWAYAKLSINAPIFFKSIDENTHRIIKDAKPQAISNIAWSFATLNVPAPNFFKLIEKNASYIINNAKPQAISNIAWSFATLSIPSLNLFKLIDQRASQIINNGTPQAISNIAWSFAKLNILGPNFFKLADESAINLVKKDKPQGISNTIWAFSELRYDCIYLTKMIDKECPQLIKQMGPQAIANVALAFAELGFKSDRYFNVLEQNIGKLKNLTNEQQICNILWSVAILDLMNENKKLLNILWTKAISTDPSKFHDDELSQLAQVHLHATANSMQLDLLPTPLQNKIVNIVSLKTPTSSRSENEYSELLHEIGFEHEREVSPCDDISYGNLFLIDYACKERKIAIEFDGPWHFLTELKDGSSPNIGKIDGRTKAKKRLLERLGWKVINITYMKDIEINKIGRGKARELKKEFLKNELDKVGVML